MRGIKVSNFRVMPSIGKGCSLSSPFLSSGGQVHRQGHKPPLTRRLKSIYIEESCILDVVKEQGQESHVSDTFELTYWPCMVFWKVP